MTDLEKEQNPDITVDLKDLTPEQKAILRKAWAAKMGRAKSEAKTISSRQNGRAKKPKSTLTAERKYQEKYRPNCIQFARDMLDKETIEEEDMIFDKWLECTQEEASIGFLKMYVEDNNKRNKRETFSDFKC